MARQMKAEREKRAQILEAEGMRAAEILRAEGEKQGAILQAEGRKEAAFRDAEAREREAEAEAKATVMVSDSIATSGTQALNYFIAQKYTEAISQFATSPNAKTILFPVEATQLIGTLGGIGELAKEALATKKSEAWGGDKARSPEQQSQGDCARRRTPVRQTLRSTDTRPSTFVSAGALTAQGYGKICS